MVGLTLTIMLGSLSRALFASMGLLALLASGCESPSAAKARPANDVASPSRTASAWWVSPEDCRRSLELQPPQRAAGRARIGSWNIRWFPDGRDGNDRNESGTDVEWAACGIARLEVDLLAVQEIKLYRGGKSAVQKLLTALDRHTQGRWKLVTEQCGKPEDGHVGLLWDTSRVKAQKVEEWSEPLVDNACDPDWRPGVGGYFAFPGGFDAHVIALHNVAGAERARFDGRQRAFARFDQMRSSAVAKHHDTDVILLGDLNTTGCEDCEPARTPAGEVELLRATLAKAKPPLEIVPPNIPCTEYHDDAPFLLDHFVVSARTRELPKGARAVVDGYCTESKCRRDYEPGERDYYEDLSDHCPILLDFDDRDLD